MTKNNERGQALILITIAISLLFGMLALVVDVGWAYYKKQTARAAAEAAAIDAAEVTLNNLLAGANFSCGAKGLQCQSASPCPSNISSPADNIQTGCMYAAANGFRTGGAQRVMMAS